MKKLSGDVSDISSSLIVRKNGTEISDPKNAAFKKINYYNIFSDFFDEVAKEIPDPRADNSGIKLGHILRCSMGIFIHRIKSMNALMDIRKKGQSAYGNILFFDRGKLPTDRYITRTIDKFDVSLFIKITDKLVDDFFKYLLHESYTFVYHGKKLLAIALDGTGVISSHKIHCPTCCVKKHDNGINDYEHNALCAAVVSVKDKKLGAFPIWVEHLQYRDGVQKNDSERVANKRWINAHHSQIAAKGVEVVYLGDDIYSCDPICKLVKSAGAYYVSTCKEASHKILYSYIEGAAPDFQFECQAKNKKGVKEKVRIEFYSGYPIKDSLQGQAGCNPENIPENVDLIVATIVPTIAQPIVPKKKDKESDTQQKWAFITNLPIDTNNLRQSLKEIIEIGRGRWGIEDMFNTMKNRGSEFTHSYGHGKQGNACRINILFNILAFGVHKIMWMLSDIHNEMSKAEFNKFINSLSIVLFYGLEFLELAEDLGLIKRPDPG
jgi:hypothetical protein